MMLNKLHEERIERVILLDTYKIVRIRDIEDNIVFYELYDIRWNEKYIDSYDSMIEIYQYMEGR